jgi:hypothetical protein
VGRVGREAFRRSLRGRRVAKEERRLVCSVRVSYRRKETALKALTVDSRCAALEGVVVGNFEPSAGVTALSRAVFVRLEVRRDTGRVGLVASSIRRTESCRLAFDRDFVLHARGRRTMSKRDRPVGWDAARVEAGSFRRDGSWRVMHGRGGRPV